MAALKDIVYFMLDKYPDKDKLFNARITKMVYLVDWYSANVYKKQVSEIEWFFNNFGPYVTDVIEMAKENHDTFSIKEVESYYGDTTRVINIISSYSPNLSEEEKLSIIKVIDITKNKTWDQFITLVYSTYPIVVSSRYSKLNLLSLAEEYQAKKRERK